MPKNIQLINGFYEPPEDLEAEISEENLLSDYTPADYEPDVHETPLNVRNEMTMTDDVQGVYQRMMNALMEEELSQDRQHQQEEELSKLSHQIDRLEEDRNLTQMQEPYEEYVPEEEGLTDEAYQRDALYRADMNTKFERYQELKEEMDRLADQFAEERLQAQQRAEERFLEFVNEYNQLRLDEVDKRIAENELLQDYVPEKQESKTVYDLNDIQNDMESDYGVIRERLFDAVSNEVLPFGLRYQQDERMRELQHQIIKLENDPDVKQVMVDGPYDAEVPDPSDMEMSEFQSRMADSLKKYEADLKYIRLQELREEMQEALQTQQRGKVEETIRNRYDEELEKYSRNRAEHDMEAYNREEQQKEEEARIRQEEEEERKREEAAERRRQEEARIEEEEALERQRRAEASQKEAEEQQKQRNIEEFKKRQQQIMEKLAQDNIERVKQQKEEEERQRAYDEFLKEREAEAAQKKEEAVKAHREETYKKFVNLVAGSLKAQKKEEAVAPKADEAQPEGAFTLEDILGDEEEAENREEASKVEDAKKVEEPKEEVRKAEEPKKVEEAKEEARKAEEPKKVEEAAAPVNQQEDHKRVSLAQMQMQEKNEQVFDKATTEKKMIRLTRILDRLQATKNGYFGHSNTTEYDHLVKYLMDVTADPGLNRNLDMKHQYVDDLLKATEEYLSKKSLKTSWHSSGDIRRDGALEILTTLAPEKAVEYAKKANDKRFWKSQKYDLDAVADKPVQNGPKKK